MNPAVPQDPNTYSDPIDAMVSRAARMNARPIDYWDVPAIMGEQRHVQFKQNGQVLEIECVGFVLLTVDEQKMAISRAGEAAGLAHESCKLSLASFRCVGDQYDRRVSVADGSADALWMAVHPAVRDLFLIAYATMHQPSEQAAVDFLASRRRTPRPPAPAAEFEPAAP